MNTTERFHFHFPLSCTGEGNGNPLQCSCLENPRDGGAWWAAVYGVPQSQTRLKQLSSNSSSSNEQCEGKQRNTEFSVETQVKTKSRSCNILLLSPYSQIEGVRKFWSTVLWAVYCKASLHRGSRKRVQTERLCHRRLGAGWEKVQVESPRKRLAWHLCLSRASSPSSSHPTLGCLVPKGCLESGLDLRCPVLQTPKKHINCERKIDQLWRGLAVSLQGLIWRLKDDCSPEDSLARVLGVLSRAHQLL